MEFLIVLRTGFGEYRMNVERVNVTAATEDFVITNKTGSQRLVIRSNRPILRAKGLKHRRPVWDIIEGTVRHKDYFRSVTQLILDVMEPPPPPPPKKPVPPAAPREPLRKKQKGDSGHNWSEIRDKMPRD